MSSETSLFLDVIKTKIEQVENLPGSTERKVVTILEFMMEYNIISFTRKNKEMAHVFGFELPSHLKLAKYEHCREYNQYNQDNQDYRDNLGRIYEIYSTQIEPFARFNYILHSLNIYDDPSRSHLYLADNSTIGQLVELVRKFINECVSNADNITKLILTDPGKNHTYIKRIPEFLRMLSIRSEQAKDLIDRYRQLLILANYHNKCSCVQIDVFENNNNSWCFNVSCRTALDMIELSNFIEIKLIEHYRDQPIHFKVMLDKESFDGECEVYDSCKELQGNVIPELLKRGYVSYSFRGKEDRQYFIGLEKCEPFVFDNNHDPIDKNNRLLPSFEGLSLTRKQELLRNIIKLGQCGFIHDDLHSYNIVGRSKTKELVLIDFEYHTRLQPNMINPYIDVVRSILEAKQPKISIKFLEKVKEHTENIDALLDLLIKYPDEGIKTCLDVNIQDNIMDSLVNYMCQTNEIDEEMDDFIKTIYSICYCFRILISGYQF